MKFAAKIVRHYPLYFRHVATLPWEIKNYDFLQIFSRSGKMQTNCILSPLAFVTHPQSLIFSVFKTANLSSYWLLVNFLCYCSFAYLLLRSIRGTLQCLSAINMVFTNEDKILIKKSLYLMGNTAKRLTDSFRTWVIS